MPNNSTNQSHEDHRDTESLLAGYIDQTLTVEERTAFEKELAEDPFLADALEGLKRADPETVARSVKQLKRLLHRTVSKKERAKRQQPAPGQYVYWAIAIILIIAVATYLVLQLLRHR